MMALVDATLREMVGSSLTLIEGEKDKHRTPITGSADVSAASHLAK
jgi:hypothetical protein